MKDILLIISVIGSFLLAGWLAWLMLRNLNNHV